MTTEHLDPELSDFLNQFLAAIPEELRDRAREVLVDRRLGGRGLRSFLALLEADERPLPPELPAELIDVYLRDDEAEPLHDCEQCGLPIPVHVGRRSGHEAEVERVYFANCPQCGGRTGRFAYWSRSEIR